MSVTLLWHSLDVTDIQVCTNLYTLPLKANLKKKKKAKQTKTNEKKKHIYILGFCTMKHVSGKK